MQKKYEYENESDMDVPAEYSGKFLLHWQAPEHEFAEKDKRWNSLVFLALLAIIAYALYTNSPVMAITFILIGVVGYISLNREPRIIDFVITRDGIAAGDEIYEFENIKSFWIFYEPGGKKVVSLRMKNTFFPFVHIPVHKEDPSVIRDLLREYIPEVKQEKSLADNFERFLGI